jgi:hypothetical protein
MRSWLVAVVMVAGIGANNAKATPAWTPEELAVLQTLQHQALPPPPLDPSRERPPAHQAIRSLTLMPD